MIIFKMTNSSLNETEWIRSPFTLSNVPLPFRTLPPIFEFASKS